MTIMKEDFSTPSDPKPMFDQTIGERIVTRKCIETGKTFELRQTRYGDVWFPEIKYCDEVLEAHMEQERLDGQRRRQELRQKAIEAWTEENIPPYFQSPLNRDYEHLDWDSIDRALSWNGESMALKGATRKGKTRSLYEIAKKNAHLFPYIETAERLARLLGTSLSESAGKHGKLMWDLRTAKLLCIDDLGKESVTARTQADLFEIVNYRLEQNLPTILTTNYDGKGLSKRYSDSDFGIPLVARISEYKIIQFA